MTNSDVFSVSKLYMYYVNSEISAYTKLYHNYYDNGFQRDANIRLEKACAFSVLSDDIDAIIHKHYGYVRVTDMLDCESFIWSIINRISERIDNVMQYGYDYVMHSYKLKAQYEVYTNAYEQLHVYCDMFGVFTGNMH